MMMLEKRDIAGAVCEPPIRDEDAWVSAQEGSREGYPYGNNDAVSFLYKLTI